MQYLCLISLAEHENFKSLCLLNALNDKGAMARSVEESRKRAYIQDIHHEAATITFKDLATRT